MYNNSEEVGQMTKRSCANCGHHKWYPGGITKDFVQRPDIHECTCQYVPYTVFDEAKQDRDEKGWEWDPDVMPEICGYYTPELVGECKQCGKYVETPRLEWELWVEDPFGTLPVCSKKCQRKLQARVDRQVKKIKEGDGEDE